MGLLFFEEIFVLSEIEDSSVLLHALVRSCSVITEILIKCQNEIVSLCELSIIIYGGRYMNVAMAYALRHNSRVIVVLV